MNAEWECPRRSLATFTGAPAPMPFLLEAFDATSLARNAEALKRDVPGWCADSAAPFFGDRSVSPGLVDWVARQLVETPLIVQLQTMACYSEEFRQELAEFSVPTLILHGDRDVSAPLEFTGARVAGILEASELVTVPGAGHGVYVSDHETINAELLRFVTSRSVTSPSGVTHVA